jgi:hypothetical protein
MQIPVSLNRYFSFKEVANKVVKIRKKNQTTWCSRDATYKSES